MKGEGHGGKEGRFITMAGVMEGEGHRRKERRNGRKGREEESVAATMEGEGHGRKEEEKGSSDGR